MFHLLDPHLPADAVVLGVVPESLRPIASDYYVTEILLGLTELDYKEAVDQSEKAKIAASINELKTRMNLASALLGYELESVVTIPEGSRKVGLAAEWQIFAQPEQELEGEDRFAVVADPLVVQVILHAQVIANHTGVVVATDFGLVLPQCRHW